MNYNIESKCGFRAEMQSYRRRRNQLCPLYVVNPWILYKIPIFWSQFTLYHSRSVPSESYCTFVQVTFLHGLSTNWPEKLWINIRLLYLIFPEHFILYLSKMINYVLNYSPWRHYYFIWQYFVWCLPKLILLIGIIELIDFIDFCCNDVMIN